MQSPRPAGSTIRQTDDSRPIDPLDQGVPTGERLRLAIVVVDVRRPVVGPSLSEEAGDACLEAAGSKRPLGTKSVHEDGELRRREHDENEGQHSHPTSSNEGFPESRDRRDRDDDEHEGERSEA